MYRSELILLIFFSSFFKLSSQSYSVKIVDSLTKNPIPFVNIYFSNNTGIISDDLGTFELIKSQLKSIDSIYISSMGYKKKSFIVEDFKDTLVTLSGPD